MKTNNLIIAFILAIATMLRFYHFFDIPYTLDELSALNRTFYADFSELIEKGIYNDGHPALIQVFLYYWVHLFGYSEWVVKLPFLLMGLASVFMVYRIGKEWFSETVGIFSSACLATLQFTVMYSQIARPYASGLFFVLGFTIFWTKWLKTIQLHWLVLSGYIIFAALCAYNHYFSLLQALLIAVAGLFFVSNDRFWKYFLLNACAVLLFLPHISVSLHQMSMGGLNWLSAPTYMFFAQYFFLIFHFSYVLLFFIIAIVIIGLVLFIKQKKFDSNWRYRILSLTMFLFPILFGFYYSVLVKPILQFSVLIFSLPFFFLFIFSFWPNIKPKMVFVITFVLVAMNVYTLVFNRRYYTFFYNQAYDAIAKNQIALMDSLKKPVTLLINGYEPFFLNYYSVKYHHPIPCDLYTYDDFNNVSWEKYISVLKTDYIAMAHVGVTHLEFIDIAQKYFPYFVKKSCGFAYEWYVFTRIPNTLSFFKMQKELNLAQCQDSIAIAKDGFLFKKGDEWGPMLETSFAELNLRKHDLLHIQARLDAIKSEGILVCEIRDNKDSLMVWKGSSTQHFAKKNQHADVFLTLRLTDLSRFENHFRIRTYYWNKSKESVLLNNLKISVEQGNSYIYAIWNNF